MAYVYRHLRKDTAEVFYIGIGSDTKYKRANEISARTKYWKHVANKVGRVVEIIEDDLTWEEACEREKYWIKFYGRKDLKEGNLVNMTDGGDGTLGHHHSDEAKHKISVASKGRFVSEETRKKLSDANKGKIPPVRAIEAARIANTGRVTSEVTKQKLREFNKYTSDSKRLKCSIASKSMSKEAREMGTNKRRLINRTNGEILKMQNQINDVDATVSDRWSNDQLLNNKMNQPRRRQVSQYDFDNNLIKIWDSITEAGRVYGSGVSITLMGKQTQSKGYYWRYTDNQSAGIRYGGKTKK
jgi:hypothetical protein